jgi:crotonobetainyl-CoA:carnitine CoA-transferase CaiB-like acyl-CoA transferase
MGADVIKVEPPAGDMARASPPIRNGESVSFVALNRNKRSLVLDLKHKHEFCPGKCVERNRMRC